MSGRREDDENRGLLSVKVLGIDTSTDTGGAALLADKLVGEYMLGIGTEHSRMLMPAIERLMRDAGWRGEELDAIAVANGPGSFTGLRIGVTTAKALAYAWQIPVIGVNTLEAMAWQVSGFPGVVLSALNARRGLVFGAVYRVAAGASALPVPLRPPDNLLMTDLLQWVVENGTEQVCVVGNVHEIFAEPLRRMLGARWVHLPQVCTVLHPAGVASLGAACLAQGHVSTAHDAISLLPDYARKAEAQIKWEKALRS
jgi:tRNA threonylcarbamoyladenosine biosynthesis protein TsaB